MNLQENIHRIKEVMGIVTETRQGMFNWFKEKLPNTPEYVIRDWVYKMVTQSDDINSYEGITEWIDEYVKDMEWEFQKDFPISMDIFTDKTKKELQNRIGGEIRQDVGKDIERHKVQQDLLKSQGISKEPIIIFKTKNGKYELGEGWHRTTQSFKMYPEGYKQPKVYICLNAKWVNENVAPNHDGKAAPYGSGYKPVKELVTDIEVICSGPGCNHKWKIADGGKDPYLCHKCGTDNTPEQLNEKCWPGYTKKGMKTMFGKKYPNCVKK